VEVSRKLLSWLAIESGMAAGAMALLFGAVLTGSALAATMIATGRVSTERLRLASQSAVGEVSSGLEQRGSVFATTNGADIQTVLFEVISAPGSPVSHDPAQKEALVTYSDDTTIVRDVAYQTSWVFGDGDQLLEAGETAEVRVELSGIAVRDRFTLEMRPVRGRWVTLALERPPGDHLDQVVRLR
jgi:archaellin